MMGAGIDPEVVKELDLIARTEARRLASEWFRLHTGIRPPTPTMCEDLSGNIAAVLVPAIMRAPTMYQHAATWTVVVSFISEILRAQREIVLQAQETPLS